MSSFNLRVLAADEPLYEGPCQSIIIPTVTGLYGIMAHHSNMIGAIVPGELSYRFEGEEMQKAAVSAGLVKVENNEVLILVDSAERPEEIDVNRAKREADEAREKILQKKSIHEYRSAQAQLARAINRLKIASGSGR